MSLTSPWDAAHHPARSLLLFRGMYALLALDAWTLMLEHGGRYGVGDFNVAHFDILHWLAPLPTPALYLGLVTIVGLYACLGALGLLARFDVVVPCLLYTLSWTLSMHDSYQHHYLLSWLLSFGIAAPDLNVRDCVDRQRSLRSSAFPLVASCCAVVYSFTALSKTSSLWLRGVVLQRLAESGGPIAWAPNILQTLGISEPTAWMITARGIPLLQLVIATGFVLSIYRDAHPARPIRLLCGVALAGAFAFHVSTELTPSFAIGWFSYYMLWIGAVALLPAAWLARLLGVFARLARAPKIERWGPTFVLPLAAVSVACAIAFVSLEELPGVGAGVVLFTGAWLLRAFLVPRSQRLPTWLAALAPTLGNCALFLTLILTDVRFDYFRRAAGELSRMGDDVRALELYRRAERHAPRGQSRRQKIEELERRTGE